MVWNLKGETDRQSINGIDGIFQRPDILEMAYAGPTRRAPNSINVAPLFGLMEADATLRKLPFLVALARARVEPCIVARLG